MNCYIFDYDNVIYDNSYKLEETVDYKITEFIIKKLNISYIEATKIRKQYFNKYGTTIKGLIDNHNISPNEFYSYVNNIKIPFSKDPKLIDTLNKIKGHKYIFSNSHSNFIKKGLQQLGIHDFFKQIFDISSIQYQSKPNIYGYKFISKKISTFNYKKIYFIDDRMKNLDPCEHFNWTPILLNCHKDKNIKYKEINSIHQILEF